MSYSDYALIKKSTLTDAADAIRAQKGTSDMIDPADFGSEIRSIEGGVPIEPVLQEKTVTENGEVIPDEGYYGLSKVTVNVPNTGETVPVPEGHTEVESIITDGYSYINTYICPNPNYSIEMRFKLTEAGLAKDGAWDYLYGTRRVNSSRWAARFDNDESVGLLVVKRSYDTTTTNDGEWCRTGTGSKADYADFRTFKLLKNQLYIDDDLVYTFASTTNTEHYLYPVYLFAIDDGGKTWDKNRGRLEVQYVKLWDDNDNLVLDLIPVVKNDGTVCMYNKVNGAYYYNAGTGSFTTKLNFVIDNILYLRSEGGVKIPTGCSVAGNYTDKEGQAWLYNTVDLVTKTKTQHVRSIVLDGSESWGRNTKTFNGSTYYDFYVANPHDMRNYIATVQTNDIGPVYIKDFRVWSQYDVNNSYYTSDRLRTGFINATAVLFTGNAGALAYLNLIDKDCMGLTVDEWKAHLAVNPKTLYYAVNSPVQSTLTDDEIAVLLGTSTPEPTVTMEEAMYEYYGIDKEEYPYLYIASWYNSSKNWRIKPIFCQSIDDETGILTGVLGIQEATTKSLSDDEYNNTAYYNDINTVFNYMKESNIVFNNSYESYQSDNLTDKCMYYTNWNATYYTNWADLRTLYI